MLNQEALDQLVEATEFTAASPQFSPANEDWSLWEGDTAHIAPFQELIEFIAKCQKLIESNTEFNEYEFELFNWEIDELKQHVIRHIPDFDTHTELERAIEDFRPLDSRTAGQKAECLNKFVKENPERHQHLTSNSPLRHIDAYGIQRKFIEIDEYRDSKLKYFKTSRFFNGRPVWMVDDSEPKKPIKDDSGSIQHAVNNINPDPDKSPLYEITVRAQHGDPQKFQAKIRGFKKAKNIVEVTQYAKGRPSFRHFRLHNVVGFRKVK